MIEHALAQSAQARIIGKPCERRFAIKVKRLEPAVRQPAARDRDLSCRIAASSLPCAAST